MQEAVEAAVSAADTCSGKRMSAKTVAAGDDYGFNSAAIVDFLIFPSYFIRAEATILSVQLSPRIVCQFSPPECD